MIVCVLHGRSLLLSFFKFYFVISSTNVVPKMADKVKCRQCTYDNEPNHSICEMCRSPLSKRAAKLERKAARQLEIDSKEKEAKTKRQKSEKEHEKQVKRRERSKEHKQQEAEAARVAEKTEETCIIAAIEKSNSERVEREAAKEKAKVDRNAAINHLWKKLETTTNDDEEDVIIGLIDNTADTDKQRAVAKELIRSEFKRLSEYNKSHRCRARLIYLLAKKEISSDKATEYLKQLDELQRQIAKSQGGWNFHAGDVPSDDKTMTISGSFCPNKKYSPLMKLGDDPSFLLYGRSLVLDSTFDSGVTTTAEQVESILSQVAFFDTVEIAHSAFHEVKDYRKRVKKYISTLNNAVDALKTKFSYLFFNHTTRMIFQALLLQLAGKEEPRAITMSKLYNDQFKFVAKDNNFVYHHKTSLLFKVGRTIHTEVDFEHGFDNYLSDTIKGIDENVLKVWLERNNFIRHLCKKVVCCLLQNQAKIYQRHPLMLKKRDAAVRERAAKRGAEGGTASMKSKIATEDGRIVAKHAHDMGNATHKEKTELGRGEVISAAAKKLGDKLKDRALKAGLAKLDKKVYIMFGECRKPPEVKDKCVNEISLVSALKPCNKKSDGTYSLGKRSIRCNCSTHKRATFYFVDKNGNPLSEAEVQALEEIAANYYYKNDGKKFRGVKYC
jgi:hypothetical protein